MPPLTFDPEEFKKDLDPDQLDAALAIAEHVDRLSDEQWAELVKIAPDMVAARGRRDRIASFASILAKIGLRAIGI